MKFCSSLWLPRMAGAAGAGLCVLAFATATAQESTILDTQLLQPGIEPARLLTKQNA